MARITTSIFFTVLTFLIFHLKLLTANPTSSFHYKKFGEDPSFQATIALYGDAKVVNGGDSVQLTSSSSTAGRMLVKKPIKIVEGNKPRKSFSFSTYFSFSISHEHGDGDGDGLAFFMAPRGFNVSQFDDSSFGISLGLEKSVFVEFDTMKDVKYGDLNGNHVGIDLGSLVSTKISNLSSFNLVLNSGEKLHSWIDYEASSKRLEVRLSKIGDTKPVDPILSYLIDLSKLWKDEEIYVGLSSANGNSSQKCNVYSWSFKLRRVPRWMHSEPLDPKGVVKNGKPFTGNGRSSCILRMLAALIMGSACGALVAFSVLYLWTIFGSRRPVVPEDCAVLHPVDFEYKKMKVVVLDKDLKDGMN